MATIPVVKHKNPIKLADGNYHLYPTSIDLVKMPDGSTPAFDTESESWTAMNSLRLGGKEADEYATKEDLKGLPSSGSGVPNGGKIGQTLIKQSKTDGDAQWGYVNLSDAIYENPEDETIVEDNVVLPVKADDSDKLGGKAPEYYTNPRNLLDNSDFTNPVNQAGLGGKHGNTMYAVDRWIYNKNDASHLSLNSGLGLSFAAGIGAVLYQKLANVNIQDGKTYTLGLWTADGGQYALVVQRYHTNIGTSGYTACHNNENVIYIQNVSATQPIKYVALYEGEYTADDVPPPFIYPKRLEMLNLGLPVQPRNLLDNSNFEIAQVGYNGAHENQKYAADRWSLVGGWRLSVNGDVKTLATSSNSFDNMQQIIDTSVNSYKGKMLTAAIELSDGKIMTCSGQVPNEDVSGSMAYIAYLVTDTGVRLLICKSTSQKLLVRLDAPQEGLSISFKNIALYEGIYTVETLPQYVAPDPVLELAKCKRYFRFYKGDMYTFPGFLITNGWVYMDITFETDMVAAPDLLLPTGTLYVENLGAPTSGNAEMHVSYPGRVRIKAQLTVSNPDAASVTPMFDLMLSADL